MEEKSEQVVGCDPAELEQTQAEALDRIRRADAFIVFTMHKDEEITCMISGGTLGDVVGLMIEAERSLRVAGRQTARNLLRRLFAEDEDLSGGDAG
jgi:hypothetical protein